MNKKVNRKLVAGLFLLGVSGVAIPALAAEPDPQQCMECHEPTEDWAGMTPEQIIEAARAPGNKRHEANQALTDEQLRSIIGGLLSPK